MQLFVVMEDDVIIGSGGYSSKKIHALYIQPAYQRQGIGSHVLTFLSFPDLGFTNVFVEMEKTLYGLR